MAPASKEQKRGGCKDPFAMYMVPDDAIGAIGAVPVYLTPHVISFLRAFTAAPNEAGGALIPERIPEGDSIADVYQETGQQGAPEYAHVRISSEWPVSFHSHVAACRRVNSREDECAIFTPSGADFRMLLANPHNLSHVVAAKNGLYCINNALHDTGAAPDPVAHVEEAQASFAKGRMSEAAYHKKYMDLLGALGFCVEFFPYRCRNPNLQPRPRVLVPEERAHELYGVRYPVS